MAAGKGSGNRRLWDPGCLHFLQAGKREMWLGGIGQGALSCPWGGGGTSFAQF